MIDVEGLTKTYGSVTAIRGVDLSIAKGEIVGFLGPNGAGKSTTMKILTCFMPPTEGVARVNGFDVMEEPLKVRQSVGYLPENVPLYLIMTVERFLKFVAQAKEVDAKQQAREIDRVIGECGLEKVRGRIIGNLSKGYRQRVGLAQALINDPPILILDEPTIGLDPTQIVEIRSLIKGLGQERTVVLSSHILPEVAQVCGRVIIINRGQVIASGAPETLTSELQGVAHLKARITGSADQIMMAIQGVPGVLNVTSDNGDNRFNIEAETDRDHRAEIAKVVVNGGFDLLEFETVSLSLEDIFVQLVTNEEGRS